MVRFLHALVEGSEHHVEPSERLLLCGEGVPALPGWVVGADILELSRLFAVADPFLLLAPGVAAFLECCVVEIAMVVQQPFARVSCGRVG